MKALFIGGTGTISTAITQLAPTCGIELYLLNRGNKNYLIPENVKTIEADIHNEEDVAKKLQDMEFDVVADFIAFDTQAIQRDIRLFSGKVKQFIFISTASAYKKPLTNPYITESTPLVNPYWEYSRKKIACEEVLLQEYKEKNFPVTIVRPSHTYGDFNIPVAVHGAYGSFSVIDRIRKGKKVIVHGDGTSLWTVTHNSDFAKAFVGLMGNPHAIGEAVHITSDESLTWNQIYETIGSALGTKPIIVHIPSELLAKADPEYTGALLGDKANSVIFDNSKLKRLVPGFTATMRFDQGVRIALRNILSKPELQKADPDFDLWTDRMLQAYEAFEGTIPRFER